MTAISWFLPLTNRVWQIADVSCARLFNYLFVHSYNWQEFVLFWNSKRADWLFDIIVLSFFVAAYIKTRRYKKTTLFIALLLVAGTHVTNFRLVSRKLIPKVIQYNRLSPSLALDNYVRVKEIRPNEKTKDCSPQSFPGDHGVTCSLFYISMAILYGRTWGLLSFLSSFPIILARVAVGAHWISDVIIGSTLLSLSYLSLLFYTPFFDSVIKTFDSFRRKLSYVKFRKNI